ncbi:MAG: LysR substrate-binding domain-containing protein [Serratia proteamaculans]
MSRFRSPARRGTTSGLQCRMVTRGAGIAVVPEEMARQRPGMQVRIIALDDAWATRQLSIVVRQLAQLSLPAQRLVAFLQPH